MDYSSFYFNVLPLAAFVVLLAVLVYYYARMEERAQGRIAKLVNAYIKTTSKYKESYNIQLNNLQELLKNESIDELTYERMKQALENDYTRKREEAKMQLHSTEAQNPLSEDAYTQYGETET